jgi:hypothetical protein
MNDELQAYARETLKKWLAQCTEAQQMLFKRMYAHGKLDLPIDKVVELMPEERLSRAMEQVEATLVKSHTQA